MDAQPALAPPPREDPEGAAHELTPEFMQGAAVRLGMIAAVLVASLGLQLLLFDVLGVAAPDNLLQARVALLLLLAASAGVVAASRSQLAPRRVLDVGLIYQTVGAFLISIPPFWAASQEIVPPSLGVITWLAVWIVLFPLIVPGRPLKNLAAALASATMAPLAYGLSLLVSGAEPASAGALALWFLPYYLAAGLAVAPAFMVFQLSASVCQAQREAKELGSYQLVELLGAGGMGEVWRAEHRLLARPAAVKVIKAEALSEAEDDEERHTVQARFEREARATASLRSPHTISLYDFGSTENGSFYYVMELLQGIDLESLVERFGPLPPGRAVHVLIQACESLAEAHEQGLIHRDVKPANVFVCKLGRVYDFVKVLDFGLVRPNRSMGGGDATRLTADGFIVGTPAFMAPEQAQSRTQVDQKADLYALGCVGYWLLTGRLLFDQDSAVRMLMDHIKTEPRRPSARLGQPIPADVEDVILSCLAKNPDLRPADAEELAERLRACDLPAWSQRDARGWWEEHLLDVLEQQSEPPAPASGERGHSETLTLPVAGGRPT